MNRIEEIEKKHLEQVSAGKKITDFLPLSTKPKHKPNPYECPDH